MKYLSLALLLALGVGAAIALGGTASTGTVTACATASVPAQTVAANGSPVGTIPGASDTQCSVSTYTIPTVTDTVTVTDPATTTTTAPSPSLTTLGEQIGADSLGNLQIGGANQRTVALRFKSTGGTLSSLVLYFVYTNTNPPGGYFLGTGGSVRVDLAAENGGVPGKTLASSTLTSMLSANFRTVPFSSPPTLTAGTVYDVVLTNVDAKPASNYVSVDDLYSNSPTTPEQPTVPDSDLAVLMKDGSGSWAVNPRHTPILRVSYADGHADGQTYRDVRSSSGLTPVGNGSQIRETATVGASVTVSGAWVRLSRQTGTTAPLAVALSGPVTAQGSVPASAVPTSPGWVWVPWGSITLTSGSYAVTVSSAEASAPYQAFPLQDGSGVSLSTSPLQFDAGKAQVFSSGSWGDALGRSDMDWQLYLGNGPTQASASVSQPWWASDSPFNQPIPSTATVDANSGAWVSALVNSSQVNSIWVNSTAWTTTLYHAGAATPIVTVAVANTGKHIKIPYQAGWSVSPDADAHIAIIDDSTGCEYEFQQFDPSTLTSHAVAVFHIMTGSGAHAADAGVTGGEMSVLAGLITPQDVSSGAIRHALRMGTPVNGPAYRVPATRSDGTLAGGIPEGALVRLDPTLDLSQYGLTAFQTMLAKALQTYGAYVDDNSGSLTVYAESTSDGSSYSQTIGGLPQSMVSHLQVLSPLYASVALDSNTSTTCNAPY